MEARLNVFANPITAKIQKHLTAAHHVISNSTLPASTQELVRLRASQINGCGFCAEIHTKEAAQAGEDSLRLSLVATWRESTVFTEAERAALELAEYGTRLADGHGVPDDVWANAAKHYDEDQLAALVSTIALINAFNRVSVIVRLAATGDYQPGRFA